MLRIRLQRTGRKRNPTYRVVVADKARPAKGKTIEVVGYYLPAQKEPVFEVNEERISYWTSQGAIPTDTLARLLAKKGIKDMEKYMDRYVHKKKRKGGDEEEASGDAAPAPAADASGGDAASEEAEASPDAEKADTSAEEASDAESAANEKPEEKPKEEAPREEASADSDDAPADGDEEKKDE